MGTSERGSSTRFELRTKIDYTTATSSQTSGECPLNDTTQTQLHIGRSRLISVSNVVTRSAVTFCSRNKFNVES